MKIAIGSDHAGFEVKKGLIQLMRQMGHEVQDYGTESLEACDYPLFAEKVATAVSKKQSERGILICGNGIGMSIVANKIPGIRAALVLTEKMAIDTRQHHDSNILSLAGRDLPKETNLRLAEIWLTTPFSHVERHERRVQEIMEIEKKYLKDGKKG
jgi:ribose 5-phosphate isomerase B